jgi:UDP-N-acetylmuramoyl-tripeptide--D-alanyl-D-alanine ligase
VVARVPASLPAKAPLLVVDDTLKALNDLGAAGRERSKAGIVAVTGSVGKTGTKEALRHCLGRIGPAYASAGSFNNLWGVPVSLARLPPDASFGVFEIGMNHAGEIRPLAALARPHVALITTVEAVHSEFFPDIGAIADAKAEILEGIEPGGAAVLNRDNPMFERLEARAKALRVARVVSFGSLPGSTVRVTHRAPLSGRGSAVEAEIGGKRIMYTVGIAGEHWVMNSLAVVAVAHALKADVARVVAGLADLQPLKGRGQRHRVEIGADSFELIDDSYNASPASMRAAFQTLGAAAAGPRGRHIAALGDMLELGPRGPDLHAALAADLAAAGVDLVFTAGTLMRALHDKLPQAMRGAHAASAGELIAPLHQALRGGDVVLVKGSNGSRMGKVVEALLAGMPAPARAAQA